MTDAWYLRALYDKSSGAYISTGARWVEGEPSLEYWFTLIESEDESVAWQGGLEKYWLEEDDHPCGEVIVFAEYDNEAAFDADVAQIQQEAKERSQFASIEQIRGADRARILLFDHHKAKRDAQLAKHSFESFMDDERMDNPEFAEMDDTEVFEHFIIETEWHEEAHTVAWQEYSGEALQGFLSRAVPYVYPREKWKPDDKPMLDQFFEEYPQPIWLEDQLRTALDEQAGVEIDTEEDSPWNDIEE